MKIASVDVFPTRLPFRGTFKIAGGALGQPIAKSAIDTALHDLICKRMNATLRHYIGDSGQDSITLS